MSRERRLIKAGACYEICFRARETLPFVAYRVIALIICSVVARTQRDNKVTLCHDLWNGSHPHIVIIPWDAQQCVNFYSEIQKKITDSLKRLLGLDYLSIWEGEPMVSKIGDIEMAKDRIAYLYANPGQDNLEESIEKFPGYSSWKEFRKSENKLDAKTEAYFPWIRLPSIPKIDSRVLSEDEDARLVRLLRYRNKKKYALVREPNRWMRCFGVKTDEEASKINKDIIERIHTNESEAAEKRKKEGKTVMGAARLRSQPILAAHTPKKRDRRIFVMASIKELRIRLIREQKEFSKKCRECYEAWKKGDFKVKWPPGAFKPKLPPNANVLSDRFFGLSPGLDW